MLFCSRESIDIFKIMKRNIGERNIKMLNHKRFHPNVQAKKEGKFVGEMNGDGSEPLPIRHSKKALILSV